MTKNKINNDQMKKNKINNGQMKKNRQAMARWK